MGMMTAGRKRSGQRWSALLSGQTTRGGWQQAKQISERTSAPLRESTRSPALRAKEPQTRRRASRVQSRRWQSDAGASSQRRQQEQLPRRHSAMGLQAHFHRRSSRITTPPSSMITARPIVIRTVSAHALLSLLEPLPLGQAEASPRTRRCSLPPPSTSTLLHSGACSKQR